ncbi:disulfide bond formation protein B [Tritonibacter multivorans]|uniref:Disulfide bond formation protein B n=1 Tax=Tritonibacter multivorans TaxID=928856 RepID=A0A0P1GIH3_9RHOB|nr:disulfide bond formation protein B [Tritonibacter multivorans]MDA7420319.1 disulfide bond formation protein B [Tritonibacter multivorans]CUH81826.1 disulfide bond formation protein B [Tritonibacter multivorans]SFC44572.1 Disulfide bond formation protein DsbB [Tritonibacter multivorans]
MSKLLTAIAAAGSAALLLGALGFQYIGDMPPCKMCYWQRYPHVAAVGIGLLALMIPGAILPYLGALALLVTAGIGIFHAGVEQGIWEGPTTCTSQSIEGLSADELLNQILSAPVVRCDDIPWEMFGLSMAGWNAVVSLGLAAIWIAAARSATR